MIKNKSSFISNSKASNEHIKWIKLRIDITKSVEKARDYMFFSSKHKLNNHLLVSNISSLSRKLN